MLISYFQGPDQEYLSAVQKDFFNHMRDSQFYIKSQLLALYQSWAVVHLHTTKIKFLGTQIGAYLVILGAQVACAV